MAIKIITLPFNEEKEMFLEEAIDNFCLNKKIIKLKEEFFVQSGKAYWTIFVEYETILPKIKEETNLSEAEKILFEKLRVWRREKAEENGIPVYLISTNEQLKEIIRKRPKTFEEIKRINGFGKKKIEKYGKELIEIITNFYKK